MILFNKMVILKGSIKLQKCTSYNELLIIQTTLKPTPPPQQSSPPPSDSSHQAYA